MPCRRGAPSGTDADRAGVAANQPPRRPTRREGHGLFQASGGARHGVRAEQQRHRRDAAFRHGRKRRDHLNRRSGTRRAGNRHCASIQARPHSVALSTRRRNRPEAHGAGIDRLAVHRQAPRASVTRRVGPRLEQRDVETVEQGGYVARRLARRRGQGCIGRHVDDELSLGCGSFGCTAERKSSRSQRRSSLHGGPE